MPTSVSLRVATRAAGMAITRSKRSSPSVSEAAANNSAGTRAKKSKMVKRELKVEVETNGNNKITVSEAVIDSFKASTKRGKAKTVKKEVKIELETSEEVKSDVVESKAMDYISEFRKGLEHVLYIDPSLKKIVESSNFLPFSIARIKEEESMTCFEYLASGIIGQQVSGAAAKSIERKFRLLFYKGDKQPEDVTNGEVAFPTAQQVLEKSIEQLRFAGLSARKAEYISGLAEAFSSGKLSDVILKSANDDDIVDMLVALKGIGPWSADMFLLFCLRRMDVFSVGDLGVQRGVSHYIKQRPWLEEELKTVDWSKPLDGLHSPGKSDKAKSRKAAKVVSKSANGNDGKWKIPHQREMEYVAHKFQPYRSAFQMVMWKLASVDLTILEGSQKRR